MTFARDGRWRLPDGIEEVLPDAAWQLEHLRYRLLGLYARWGYDLVIPPLIEYLDSLLIGAGHDLELDTFKLTDQVSGRMMGVRADMTPQVARIDAHRLGRDGPVRLCYLGAVLHTRPGPFGGGRSPLQLGAELYGHGGIEADLEVTELMLATLTEVPIAEPVTVDLGHVGIVQALASACDLDPQQRESLYEILERKSIPELESALAESSLSAEHAHMWRALGDLQGDRRVLGRARDVLASAGSEVADALDYLDRIGQRLEARHPSVRLHFDLAEMRGYRYHTGLVFAVYVGEGGAEIARGGRYDGIGAAFGRARPATGFSTDLRRLAEYATDSGSATVGAIAAPAVDDAVLARRIHELRSTGERVIVMLPEQTVDAAGMGCDRQLVAIDNDWKLEEI